MLPKPKLDLWMSALDYTLLALGYQEETLISRTGSRTLSIRGISLALQENLLYPTTIDGITTKIIHL